MTEMLYDVMILGAGVAGATAGALLANQGLNVVLIERDSTKTKPKPKSEWITRSALPLLNTLQIDAKKLLSSPIKGATFHSADLTQSANTPQEPPPAFRIDYTECVKRIRDRAKVCGIKMISGLTPTEIQPGENTIEALFAEHAPIRARFLLLANGALAETGPDPSGTRWIAQLCTNSVDIRPDDHMHWVLGLDDGQSLVAWWFDRKMIVINCWTQGPGEAVRTRLQSFLAQACQTGLLPIEAVADERRITLRPTPAISALEMDSHVDKGTLRIGDAGGFVAAGSQEGIYPAMRSAQLAAEVIGEAANSCQPQDILQRFSTDWRTTMASYMATIEIQTPFLIPLVFSNQQMAKRMADAFWRSETS